jgi:hypothetical protein
MRHINVLTAATMRPADHTASQTWRPLMASHVSKTPMMMLKISVNR